MSIDPQASIGSPLMDAAQWFSKVVVAIYTPAAAYTSPKAQGIKTWISNLHVTCKHHSGGGGGEF